MGSAAFTIEPPQKDSGFTIEPPKKSASAPTPSVGERLTRGYNPDVEAFAEKHPILGPPARFLDAAGGAVMSTPAGIYSALRHPIDTAKQAAESLSEYKNPATWKAIPSLLPEALGQGVGSVAAGEAAGEVPKVVSKARSAIGEAIHTPEGSLTPAARTVSKTVGGSAGAAAGHAIPVPGAGYAGTYLGYKLGPSLMERAFPKPSAEIPKIGLPENAFDVSGAEKAVTPFEGVGAKPKSIPSVEPSIRRVPGEIAPEAVSSGAPERIPAVAPRSGTSILPGGGVINRAPIGLLPENVPTPMPSVEPAPLPKGSLMDRLGKQIEEGAGVPKVQPNVPLRDQIGPKSAMQRPPLIENPDIGGDKIKAVEKTATIVPEETARQMGAPPLKPDVSLKEQRIPNVEDTTPSPKSALEERYPDKAVRQMVHANGPEMVDAIGEDTETLKAVHNLTNPDVRQAMINSGEDMGQTMINNRKASGDMTRQDAFRKLLSKGLTPKQIVDLAKKPLE